jgi:hypothetical protein
VQRDGLSEALLAEIDAAQGRLYEWLQEPRNHQFLKPRMPYVPDPTIKTWKMPYVGRVTILYLTRLCWDLKAILILCRADLAVQSQPILRTMVESAIDLTYISTNPQTLVTKWCLSEEAEHYYFWSTHPECERPSGYGFTEKEVLRRLESLNRHQPHRNDKPWKAKQLTGDWDLSNLALRERKSLEVLGGEAALYGVYKLLCGNVHGGTDTVHDFAIAADDGTFQTVTGSSGRKRVFVPATAVLCTMSEVLSALRCGAPGLGKVAPDFAAVDTTWEQLIDAIAADFARAQS